MRKLLSLLLAISVCLSFVACGAAPQTSASSTAMDMAVAPSAAPEYEMAEGGKGSDGTSRLVSNAQGVTVPRDDRKIILTTYLHMETLEFDSANTTLLDALEQAGGYVSSTSVEQNRYDNSRYATYEFRVPAESYGAFLEAASGAGNVLNKTENTQDITAQYVDVEARLKSLKLQEERLLEMMAQAGTLETLLAIQNQLTEVQYQIESYTSTRNTYDNLISYSTVTIYLSEVKRETEVEKDTFGARIASAFGASWYRFGNNVQSFVVGVVYLLPTLLLLAVLGGALIFVVRKANKRRGQTAQRKAAAKNPSEKET